jgi:hypothetical protein
MTTKPGIMLMKTPLVLSCRNGSTTRAPRGDHALSPAHAHSSRPLRGYVREIARALRPSRGFGRGFTLVLHLYLDESKGKHDGDGDDVFVVAGYVAAAAQWDQFEKQWMDALRGKLDCFHMKEFIGLKPPEWPEARRIALQKRLFGIIDRNALFGVVCTVKHSTFWGLPEEIRKEQGHPYVLCYHLCVQACLWRLSTFYGLRSTDRLMVLMDQGNEKWGKIQARHHMMRKSPKYNPDKRLLALVEAERCEYVPLQAADILAYETCKASKDQTRPVRRSGKVLYDDLRVYGSFLAPENILDYFKDDDAASSTDKQIEGFTEI